MSAFLFVIVGATGDLARRKLFPALARLAATGTEVVVLGAARSDLDDEAYRRLARGWLADAGIDDEELASWCDACVHYRALGGDTPFDDLAERVAEVERHHASSGDRVIYLALPPGAFPDTVTGLGEAGLNSSPGWVRLVIEKPFGSDLTSAAALNELVHRYFDEDAVYRIDHYLGKETVQNLLVFRFANSLFESSWDRSGIECVEITVAEEVTAAGRGSYYEATGVVRDMVQNHLTQLLTLVAMEPPTSYSPNAIRNEKVKVLDSLRPPGDGAVVFGQYTAAGPVPAYASLDGVAPDSSVPTYIAVELAIDNWRWEGVPFYLRTGKALPRRVTQVAVTFRDNPVAFFEDATPDRLLMTLQPDEGFELRVDVKEPSSNMAVRSIPLTFSYGEQFGRLRDAYETLLEDIVEGDQTLFVRADMVEKAWALWEPLLDPATVPEPYPAGSWGPTRADEMLERGWATT